MAIDSSFEFEKRRNAPVKYDRNLVGATLRAMQRVQEIKESRERRFWVKRMAGKEQQDQLKDRIEIAQSLHMMAPSERTQFVKALHEDKSARKAKEAAMEGEASAAKASAGAGGFSFDDAFGSGAASASASAGAGAATGGKAKGRGTSDEEGEGEAAPVFGSAAAAAEEEEPTGPAAAAGRRRTRRSSRAAAGSGS